MLLLMLVVNYESMKCTAHITDAYSNLETDTSLRSPVFSFLFIVSNQLPFSVIVFGNCLCH